MRYETVTLMLAWISLLLWTVILFLTPSLDPVAMVGFAVSFLGMLLADRDYKTTPS